MVRYLLFFILSLCAYLPLEAQEHIVDTPGIRLEHYEYPYHVYYMHTTVQNNAVEIAYMDETPEQWNRKTVLLLHGKNFPAAYWANTIHELNDAGYRVIAPDALGFGKSSKPMIRYSFSLLALLTKQLLDTLHVQHTAIIGHSTGGMLATRVALEYPEMITHLILADPIGLEDWRAEGAPYRRVDEWYKEEKNASYEDVLNLHKNYYAEWKDEYKVWADLQYGMSQSANADQYAWVSALTYDMIFTEPVVYEFPNIKVPTLVIVGKDDKTKIAKGAPQEVSQHMGNYTELGIKAANEISDSRLIEYSNCGHLPFFETATPFYKDVKDFLVTPTLELVYTDTSYQLVGIGLSKKGRMFINYPVMNDHNKYAVVEIQKDGTATPYPDNSWNYWNEGEDGKKKWVSVQALYVDDKDDLWVVDAASPKQHRVYQKSNKLVQINLNNNKVKHIYPLYDVGNDSTYLNDVRVDTKKHEAYLTNSSTGGVVVVNLESGNARMLFQNSPSVKADTNYVFKIDSIPLVSDKGPFRTNADGLALSPDGQWLYFKPLSDKHLYRIQTKYLTVAKMGADELAKQVENVGDYTTTGGMIMDKNGFLYFGDIEHHAIVRIDTKDKSSKVLLTDKRLMWPDSYAISEDGYLYITCSQIDNMPQFHGGVSMRKRPYAVYRMKL